MFWIPSWKWCTGWSCWVSSPFLPWQPSTSGLQLKKGNIIFSIKIVVLNHVQFTFISLFWFMMLSFHTIKKLYFINWFHFEDFLFCKKIRNIRIYLAILTSRGGTVQVNIISGHLYLIAFVSEITGMYNKT